MKKCTLIILVLAIASLPLTLSNPEEKQKKPKPKKAPRKDNRPTLENSNKIGLGYNPLYGSPVCYTGECQMEGFGQPVFKLKYNQEPRGSCTKKVIPEHVSLDCLFSAQSAADTVSIDSLQRLKEITTHGIEAGIESKLKIFSFSYKYSKETRHMIDTLVQEQSDIFYTFVKISSMKLSMFEPMMELSKQFRHTIENMPCCNHSDDTNQDYIFDHLFSNFGYTYVKTLLLGGIAMQSITVLKSDVSKMAEQGISTKHEAKLGFMRIFKGNLQVTSSDETNRTNTFKSMIKSERATTLGGDSSLTEIKDWTKTVQSNPVLVHFGVRSILNLLTPHYFPKDKQIQEKSKLAKVALIKYLENPIFCYGDCSGHGNCVPSGYFQFGLCQCHSGWKGKKCISV